MKNKKGLIRQTIFWLFIFVVGSLIVNFIIDPSSMSVVEDKVSEVKSLFQFQKEEINKTGVKSLFKFEKEYIDYIEIKPPKDILSCSGISIAAESVGASPRSSKKNICTYYCGEDDLNYVKFECDRNQLTCYCIDD